MTLFGRRDADILNGTVVRGFRQRRCVFNKNTVSYICYNNSNDNI